MAAQLRFRRWTIGLTALLTVGWVAGAGEEVKNPGGPYKVTIKDEKPVVYEAALPIDPTPRIRYNPQGLGAQITDENGRTLHLSHFPSLNINGQFFQNGGFGAALPGGRFEKMNQPLGKTASGKVRHGFQTVYVHSDLRITFTCEVVATKRQSKNAAKRSDAVMLHYLVENKGNQPRKFGLRIYMDVYVINNDGALFAAPTTQPKKLLDGTVLKGKLLPDYVQLLERPDLQNPGFVAHLTLNLGKTLEKPDRVVLTRHGAGFGGWDMPAIQSMGDSALGIFWEPIEIKPGGKREFAYGYGQGIVPPPEGEGQYEVRLGGSFEPGKLFTVTAVVSDPAPGQTLKLELPAGVEPVEGRLNQPVPPPLADQANSAVMWKARVSGPGTFPLRISSSTGTTLTKMVTVEKVP